MKVEHNFLPEQYEQTNKPSINHNYLKQQFSDYKEIFKDLEKVVKEGDFTLGKYVDDFEKEFAQLTGTTYAIGVGSGTDALFLSLKALGIKEGDEVITTPYTFYATIGAIVTAGARPIFVDICEDDYNINPELIKKVISKKTKAILTVHWSGMPCKMDKIMDIAQKHNIFVVEDACHAVNGRLGNKAPGSFGNTGCFSFHPLKNLNVWGDGGMIVTNSKDIHDTLVLMRNHGLVNRDECVMWAYNSRLDSVQAVVAHHLLKKIDAITNARIMNAQFFDKELSNIPGIIIPKRNPQAKHVYHLYIIRAENRDKLQEFLLNNGIDAKVHYPLPMHLQPASREYGYKRGDFPIAEKVCSSVISLPVHEFITREQQEYIVKKIREFYHEHY